MKLKKPLINLGVFVLSIAVGLLVAEFGARRALNPSDFLSLEVVSDPVLGAVPSPSAMAGFDTWGFRNREVPETADIVAVGDSHTYGNTARMKESWPYVLGSLTGLRVYNMGMGGYAPNQYFYLSKTKALRLKPRMIIWGLYMGDDFEGAFSMTYGLDYWANFRALPPQKVDPNVWEDPPSDTWDRRIRVWLSRHSVVYQLVFHAGIGDRVKGDIQIKDAAQLYPGVATSLVVPEKNISEAFVPKAMMTRLDLENPNIREGMRITFELLKEMNQICRQNNVQFMVVVIPTKEMVYADYLEHNSKIPLDDMIDKLLVNERSALERTFQFMTDEHIAYVDALPALRKAADQGLYARSAGDMHPGRNGYRVIAEAVAGALKPGDAKKQP
jgi:lysophospholipase L1-like esterase